MKFFNLKKTYCKKNYTEKENENHAPQLFCVAEDWMLLVGGVLYGFTPLYPMPPRPPRKIKVVQEIEAGGNPLSKNH